MMTYCPKCGAKVSEEMAFCPKCGAPLKIEAKPAPAPQRVEKAEKHEKREKEEKHEKGEKREKREVSFFGPLVGGLILIFLGLISYLIVTGYLVRELAGALFLIIIGVIIILSAIYASSVARKRHPRT